MIARIAGAVSNVRDDLLAFAQSLVRMPSLPGEEHAAQELVAAQLHAQGLEAEVQPVRFDRLRDHPAFGDDGFTPDGRVNVIGRRRGTGAGGDSGRGSLILNGHIDVVPPGDESRWSASPWSGAIRGGRLFGRGACDMKSGLASGLFAVAALQRLGWRPARDLIIESVLTYQRLRRYTKFAFESNQFQSLLADELTRRSNAEGLYLPVESVQHSSDKLARIQSLQPLVRSGTLQFSRRHAVLLEQMRLFPKAAHDDGPDALEMAVAAARSVSNQRIECELGPRLRFAEGRGL